MCKGKEVGDNCAQIADCDPDLTCKQDLIWPYATKCQKLGVRGTPCSNTFDCSPSFFCWYMTAADAQTDTKKCLDLYYNPEFTTFGWRYVDTDDGMTNAMVNG